MFYESEKRVDIEREEETSDFQVYLTQKTLNQLRKLIRAREHSIDELSAEMGEAGASTNAWHSSVFRTLQDEKSIKIAILKSVKLPDNFTIIEPRESETIGLGSSVKVEFSSGEEVLTIVSSLDVSIEGSPLNWVSLKSPMGKVLLGKKIGDRVVVNSPKGEIIVKIKEVLPANDLDDGGQKE